MNENTSEYFLTTKTNSSEQEIHEKQELEAKIMKAKHSTHISEEHECLMKKAERVSLPNKHARIQFIAKTREQNTKKLKVKTTDARRTAHNV